MRQFRTSMGSSIESRSGPDIIHMLNSWSHLYQRGLTDVSDLAEWKAKDQGGFYDVSLASVRVQPLWRDILHAPLPAGPAGQFACHTAFAHGIMKYSKEQKLAKSSSSGSTPRNSSSKYILLDMYAKAVQGITPADVAKWAEGELRKIYR